MKEHINHIHSIKISSNFVGQRIDNFLFVYLKKISKSTIHRIIRIGAVRVNKKRIKFQYKLKIGDYLKIPIMHKTRINTSNIQCYSEKIKFLQDVIIYEDDYLLVINKPAGIAVHGGSGLDINIIEGLRLLRPKLQFLELVHRLDRATSGVLLIAKKRTSLVYLHEQLREKMMKKKYLALVYGAWNMHIKTISVPILKKNIVFRINGTKMFPEHSQKEKLTTTHFYIKERFDNIATLLIVIPITGKTHQIRIQTQHVNHPIIGDNIYGNYKANIWFKQCGLNRLFLHAHSLGFYHPDTKKFFCIKAPIDPLLNHCLYYLRNLIFNHDNDLKKILPE